MNKTINKMRVRFVDKDTMCAVEDFHHIELFVDSKGFLEAFHVLDPFQENPDVKELEIQVLGYEWQ